MNRALACLLSSTITLCGCASSGRDDALPYPPTRSVDVVDDYHGTLVADPYRWLEDLESPEVRDWAAAQRGLVDRHLAPDPLRADLRRRLEQLGGPIARIWQEDRSTKVGALEFRIGRSPAGGEVLLVTSSGAPPRVLVDPSTLGSNARLSWFRPSPDGRLVVYAVSEGGSEWVQTRICDVATGRDLPELVDGILFDQPVWTADGRGFFYVRCRRPEAGDSVMYRDPAAYYHVAGTPQEQDQLVHATPAQTAEVSLELGLSSDGRYLFIYEGGRAHHGQIGWSRTRMLTLDLGNPASPEVSAQPVAISPQRDAAYSVIATKGSTAYVFTDRDAPRRRVVAVDLDNPEPANWRDVIPQGEGVLQEVHHLGGRLVAVYLEDVTTVLRVHGLDGALVGDIPLPGRGTAFQFTGSPEDPRFTYVFESFLAPTQLREHDLETGQSTLVREASLDFAFDDFEMKQIWFPSRDGTRVPMFIVHRRGLKLDGSHPTLLLGYGSSGSVTTPMLWPELLCWIEMGGVYAVANPRGGGELGVDWHEAAVMQRKQTTFDDFIAAAEFLIGQGYTSPGKLGITGTSYGGLLVSAVMTQRPELFEVAIPRVPAALDRLRFEPGRHVEQYGHASDPAMFPYIYAYSPLHNVKPGTCYPATLIITSLNDERAPAWHAMKFTAALQAAQACPRPILLRPEAEGGHAAAATVEDWYDLTADELSFAARHLGLGGGKAER